ncbi:WD repeat domain phosphoinositide-interacting protein 4-like [Chrysoperla carnea]|uniref:WD repeat domain phosphoinositide-interacting protein 4-like n=1 Tax=Chrysoperla carnea TaxID=189513 RepID=UPI001D084BB8|nr:WD repeat domain phosphoinositide-interacting protein 4-like [Chrysoperla carnea]
MGEKVISLKFNEDKSCFNCCLENGLRIYNIEPLVELRRIDSDILGSLSQCETLHRGNLKFLVSGGSRPKFLKNAVIMYNDEIRKVHAEIRLPEDIKVVRLNTDKLFIGTRDCIYVYNNLTLNFLFKFETRDNLRGLLEVTPYTDSSERQLLVFPGRKLGSIQIIDLANTEAGTSSAPVTINAHQGELACIALNMQGTLVATASTKGTLIRVWDTTRRIQLVELRRGSDTATVYCINFSADSDFLCCSSDKGTVHIFALKDTRLNRRSALSNMGILGNYGESQWALATFTVPPECACICAFGPSSSVVAVCLDGTFHKYIFNIEGNCNRQAFDVFLDLCDDEEF